MLRVCVGRQSETSGVLLVDWRWPSVWRGNRDHLEFVSNVQIERGPGSIQIFMGSIELGLMGFIRRELITECLIVLKIPIRFGDGFVGNYAY